MGDWASTPEELLEMVAKLLKSNIADLARFASVCRSWRSVVVNNRRSLSSGIPWLLFPTGPPEETSYCLVSPFDTTRDYALSLAGGINHGHLFIGAYLSWLLIACRDATLCLYNPFSCVRVCLPRCWIGPGEVSKFVLSASPSQGVDWLLMAIVDENTLIFYKSWDQAWTSLATTATTLIPFIDLVYHHDGRFLALHASGKISVVSFQGHSHSTSEIKPHFEDLSGLFRILGLGMVIKTYLVSSSEKLLEVIQIGSREDKETVVFLVFRLDWSTESLILVNNLDDSVLFVGNNYSASLKASEIPGSRRNFIYFIESQHGSHGVLPEMAACYLQDMTIERFVRRSDRLDRGGQYLTNNAFWIMPSLS